MALLRGHLHLRLGILGYLGNEVEQLSGPERDVVPGRDGLVTLGEEQAVALGAGLALLPGGDGAGRGQTSAAQELRSEGSGAGEAEKRRGGAGEHARAAGERRAVRGRKRGATLKPRGKQA